MAGRGYTIFDTGIGRCGVAWGYSGVIGVQLPEAREIETRKRLFQLYPDARELRAPMNVEIAIEAITALLRGQAADFSDVTLDMTGIHVFNRRIYDLTPANPGAPNTTDVVVADRHRVPEPTKLAGQAICNNPLMNTNASVLAVL